MSTVILSDRLARFLDSSFVLRRGKGVGIIGDNTIDVCSLQAADWLAGGKGKNDHSKNICPVIRAFLIKLNDSDMFMNNRNELKVVVPKILGTVASQTVMIRRANVCAEFAAECSAKYIDMSAHKCNSAARRAADYAKCAAEYNAEHDAKHTVSCTECAAEYAAKCAGLAAEYTADAELRKSCIACVESMIAITD